MAEHLIIKGETKAELYATLLPQLQSLIEGESDIIANMANISACIMDTFHFWWVGFYRVIDENLVCSFLYLVDYIVSYSYCKLTIIFSIPNSTCQSSILFLVSIYILHSSS